MTKLQFLLALHDKLAGLPQNEVEERLNFYSEMIEDRMEEGLSEEEAVLAAGDVHTPALRLPLSSKISAVVSFQTAALIGFTRASPSAYAQSLRKLRRSGSKA